MQSSSPPATARPDPEALTRRVRDMIAAGRVHAARPLLGALRRMSPPSPDLVDMEARLLLREGRIPEALAELDAGLAIDTDSVELHICRADARMQAHDVPGAAADAAEAVILAPGNSQAKAVLGVILLEMNRPEDALPCLREALDADPRRASCARALGVALERTGDFAGAAAVLAQATRHSPGDVGLRTAAIMLAMRQRMFDRAADLAETARRDGVADACVFGLRGHALSSLGRHDEAMRLLRELADRVPDDPLAHRIRRDDLLRLLAAIPAPDVYNEVILRPDGDVPLAMTAARRSAMIAK